MTTKNCACLLLAILLLLFSGTSPVLAQTPDQCASVQPARPGDTLTDALSDVPAAHIDLTRVETSLSGETLTALFHLKHLPETLRFNRTEFGRGAKEYQWEVAVDVDNDRGTGPGGFDILLTAYHIAFLSHGKTGADVTAPLQEMLEASVWEINPNGSTGTLAAADLAVSPEDNTITLTGNIPGITPASRLTFSAYDAEFAAEADQIECHPSYIRSCLKSHQCRPQGSKTTSERWRYPLSARHNSHLWCRSSPDLTLFKQLLSTTTAFKVVAIGMEWQRVERGVCSDIDELDVVWRGARGTRPAVRGANAVARARRFRADA